MSQYVALEIDDETHVHAASSIAGYMTLCGLDGGLSSDHQKIAPLIIGARIDCEQCFQVITEAKRFRNRDFCSSLRKPTS